MRYLNDADEKEGAVIYLNSAIKAAKKSTCLESKCGSVIIKEEEIIGEGFNSPPANLESQRKCLTEKATYDEKITDKTCCVHAEERAIIDALKKNPEKIEGSILYFVRLDMKNNMLFSKRPYCTICSKMALDTGIKEFVLWHEEGICVYDTQEYNSLSFDYKKI